MIIDLFSCILVVAFLIQVIYIYMNLTSDNPKSICFKIREKYFIKSNGANLAGIKKILLAIIFTILFFGFWLFLIVLGSYG